MIFSKRNLIFGLLILIFGSPAFCQTALPTSWDCTPANLPVGWSTNLVSYYTTSAYMHSAPNAAKFDATGIFLSVNFVDEPDTLVYYLRGASFSGGTFNVQQSVNGTIWTDVRVFNDSNIPNTSLSSASPFKDALAQNSRYVRFFYTLKGTGNVCLDDILISKRPPGPEANMKIKINSLFIPNGGTAVIGNVTSVNVTVVNSGTDSLLRLSFANISGADASMFGIVGIPLNIAPNDSANITLNFTPSGVDGSKIATISLPNNDSDQDPYVINVWAVKGCCATEPLAPAANLNFSYVKSFKFRVNFSNPSNPPEKYLVLKKTSPITEEPVDGHTYLKGDYIGSAQVTYIGGSGYFYPANVVAGTHYYIKIFSFNGYPGYENYLTTSVASGDTATFANMIGTYYGAINFSSPTLWQDLHTLINNHYVLYYSDYETNLINNFEYRDTVVGGISKKTLTCAYSGENYVYTEPFAFTVFSREHVFCESWMPTYNDANYTSLPEYADYHNLMPVNQNKVNVYRLNYPLGKVQTIQYQYLGCKKGLDSLGHVVFEPRDNIKGDAARCMFYQIMCYDGVNGNDWFMPVIIDSQSINYGQDVALLKKWNLLDPPDNYEIARNDYINSIQTNRNPFIDHPELADLFAFDIYTAIAEKTVTTDLINVVPNVSAGNFLVISESDVEIKFELYDVNGVLKFSKQILPNSKNNINVKTFPNGMYFYRFAEKDGLIRNGKLVIQK
jgi:endonuclease I